MQSSVNAVFEALCCGCCEFVTNSEMEFSDPYRHQICTSIDINTHGLPEMPLIPEISLCLHFPGSEGWNHYWREFNKRVKEFHQSMIDFNWRIIEWYFLKSRQLERFGKKTSYVAGVLITGPRTTLIYTQTISESDVMSEIRKCLPSAVKGDIMNLESTGYKLFLSGKVFIFNDERVVAIDYDKECDQTCCYRNSLKYNLYYKNVRVDIGETFERVYGGMRYSFLVGGIGGLLVSYLTGYFRQPPIFLRKCCSQKNILWYSIARFITSATCYSVLERIMLLKFPSPKKYVLSGSTGFICGGVFGICDNCNVEKILCGATEFGILAAFCNCFESKQNASSNMVGCELHSWLFSYLIMINLGGCEKRCLIGVLHMYGVFLPVETGGVTICLHSSMKSQLSNCARTLIVVIAPLLLLLILVVPTALTSSANQKALLGFSLGWLYVFFLIGVYWMFNVLNIPSTGFIVLIALPLLGIVPAKTLAAIFMSDHNIVVYGWIVLTMAADACGLKKRLSLAILKHSSGSFRWIFIDLYLATVWLAMWINCVAAVFFMMKVIDDILETIQFAVSSGALGEERMILLKQIQNQSQKQNPKDLYVADIEDIDVESSATPEPAEKMASGINDKVKEEPSNADALKAFHAENGQLINGFGGELLYVIAVAANIGGTLWPYGNPVGFDIMKIMYTIPKVDKEGKVVLFGLTQASWIVYSFPLLIINASVALIYLLETHFGQGPLRKLIFGSRQRIPDFTQSQGTLKTLGKDFSNTHAALPIWNFREKVVTVLTVAGIVLCLLRQPVFLTGWAELIRVRHDDSKTCEGLRHAIGDSVALTIITLLIFLIPSWSIQVFSGPPAAGVKAKATGANSLGWRKLQSSYPYTVIFLIGVAGCIGRFSEKPIATYMSKHLVGKLPASNVELLKSVLMLITVGASVFIPNPATSIAITQLWFKMLSMYNANKETVHGGSLLPILSVACLCFVIPASSVPTAMIYRYSGKKTLSAWYLLKAGVLLLICTLVPTLCYALLWTPNSLAVFFI